MTGYLPKFENRHARGLQVKNETTYDTIQIRSMLIGCLHSLGMRRCGVVRITYSSTNTHAGRAAIGDSAKRHGYNMTLTLPRDPSRLNSETFARVMHHEAMHWMGARHEDMTKEQRYCEPSWVPSWFPPRSWKGETELRERERVQPNLVAVRAKRIEHVRKMVTKSERRMKLAITIAKKWKRRLAALERATVKKEEAAWRHSKNRSEPSTRSSVIPSVQSLPSQAKAMCADG